MFHKDMADAVVDIAVINHPLNGGDKIVQAGTQATGIRLEFRYSAIFNFSGTASSCLSMEKAASIPQARCHLAGSPSAFKTGVRSRTRRTLVCSLADALRAYATYANDWKL